MADPLPLEPGARPCVRCGYCCSKTTCGLGEWVDREHRCRDLVIDPDGRARCGMYEQILSAPLSWWRLSPAFGAGCCSPLNSRRRQFE